MMNLTDIKDFPAAILALTSSMFSTDENGAQFMQIEENILELMKNYANSTHGPKEGAICVNCDGKTTGLACER